jgi:hypothetical protein
MLAADFRFVGVLDCVVSRRLLVELASFTACLNAPLRQLNSNRAGEDAKVDLAFKKPRDYKKGMADRTCLVSSSHSFGVGRADESSLRLYFFVFSPVG